MEYFAFQWHITDSCDQRCEHCYIFSEGHPELVEMSFPKAPTGRSGLCGNVPPHEASALFLYYGRRPDSA